MRSGVEKNQLSLENDFKNYKLKIYIKNNQ